MDAARGGFGARLVGKNKMLKGLLPRDLFKGVLAPLLDAASLYMLFLAHCSKAKPRFTLEIVKAACLHGYEKVIELIYNCGYRDPEAFKWLAVGKHTDLIGRYANKVGLTDDHFYWAAGYRGDPYKRTFAEDHWRSYASGLLRSDRSAAEIFALSNRDTGLHHSADYFGRIDVLERLWKEYPEDSCVIWIFCYTPNRIQIMEFLLSRGAVWDHDAHMIKGLKTTTPEILQFAWDHGWRPDLDILKLRLEKKKNLKCFKWSPFTLNN